MRGHRQLDVLDTQAASLRTPRRVVVIGLFIEDAQRSLGCPAYSTPRYAHIKGTHTLARWQDHQGIDVQFADLWTDLREPADS